MQNRAETEILKGYPDILDFKQMCEILHVSRQNGYKLLQDGEIKHRKVGRKYIISKLSVIDFFNDDSQP